MISGIIKHMRTILLLCLVVFCTQQLSAQTAVAKLKFEDAETAYTEGDYTTTLSKLQEAEKLFGKVNPPILYLRIMAGKKMLDLNDEKYGEEWASQFQTLKKSCDLYLKQYESLENNEDKYRDVYNVSDAIQYYPKSAEFYQAIQAVNKNDYKTAVPLFHKAIAKGDAFAYVRLATPYYYGNTASGIEQNYVEAMALYKKGADAGDPTAFYYMGELYYYGKGVEKDRAKAMEWYLKAAGKGHLDAMYSVGYMYELGLSVTKDLAKALQWYLKAAEKGHATSINEAGVAYWLGRGTAENYELALQWFTKAVAIGHSDGMRNMGNLYYDGSGVPKDRAKALEWYLKAANKGNIAAMEDAAAMYYNGKVGAADYQKALTWYTKAAEGGNIRAIKALGKMYKEGYYITKDFNAAVKWYSLAVDKNENDHESMYELGKIYLGATAFGLIASPPLAMEWFNKAAAKGNPDAMTAIGEMYASGNGVKKDKKVAKEWFAKAAVAQAAKKS
jgi:TPR repeat protein